MVRVLLDADRMSLFLYNEVPIFSIWKQANHVKVSDEEINPPSSFLTFRKRKNCVPWWTTLAKFEFHTILVLPCQTFVIDNVLTSLLQVLLALCSLLENWSIRRTLIRILAFCRMLINRQDTERHRFYVCQSQETKDRLVSSKSWTKGRSDSCCPFKYLC